MRDLWRVIEACKAKGHMVRLAFFPGGNMNVAIYDSEKQSKQYMYDKFNYEDLEKAIMKDWGHLIKTPSEIKGATILPSFPLPAGFPKL